MNFENEILLSEEKISINNLLKERGLGDFRSEIINGLIFEKKFIPSKYFYNNVGSQLFEKITHLEEYYPTRTEKSILIQYASEIVKDIEKKEIIELGSGDSSKVTILLDAIPENKRRMIRYLPVDVSQAAILQSGKILNSKFPELIVQGFVLDFTTQLDQIQRKGPALICFFGSTIGNFDRNASLKLLKEIGRNMNKGDVLLLGMDLIKQTKILHSAYNDSKGVTAAFNKNILNTLNDIIQSDFKTEDFDHLAFYNEKMSRIEMHLVANKDVSIKSHWFREDLRILKGENIHTENSHKYSMKDIMEFSHATGLNVNQIHTDPKKWFALVEFEK